MECKSTAPLLVLYDKQLNKYETGDLMVEEGLRRMRNCSRGMEWQERRQIMEEWARKLKRSGYPVSVRHQVVTEALRKYEKMCKVEDNGGRPIHRAREWQQSARRLEKELRTANWHKTDKAEISAPLIVDPTAGKLTKKLKETCEKFFKSSGISVTVRERAGLSLKSDAKSEPLRRKGCNRTDCLCCAKGKPGMCETNSVGYRITCEGCQVDGKWAFYEGETGQNA